MKKAVDKDKRGLTRGLTLVPRRSSRYPEVKLADLDYADDTALFKETDVEMAKTTEAIPANGTNVEELNSRIGKASAAFRELDKVWRDRNINLDTKLKFYNACVLSTLLYPCECWTLTERDEARLDAFDMRCQRKILRVIWSQHITNSSIRSKIKQPQLTAVIKTPPSVVWSFTTNEHGPYP